MSTKTLPTGTWPNAYDLVILDEVDSTMAEASRRGQAAIASGGAVKPVWIMAHHQTAGRGRRGRAWRMPAGNLAATLLMPCDLSPAQAALTSFVAALALHQSLAHFVPRGDLSLKWPNDVLLQGRKVAGILLESSGRAAGLDWLSVGIGVNLAAAPDMGDLEAGAVAPISLADVIDMAPTPQTFLTSLALAFERNNAQFLTQGFDPIRAAWLTDAARLGERITARTGQDVITGRFDTIDAEGNLVLFTDQGARAIAAAEVFF